MSFRKNIGSIVVTAMITIMVILVVDKWWVLIDLGSSAAHDPRLEHALSSLVSHMNAIQSEVSSVSNNFVNSEIIPDYLLKVDPPSESTHDIDIKVSLNNDVVVFPENNFKDIDPFVEVKPVKQIPSTEKKSFLPYGATECDKNISTIYHGLEQSSSLSWCKAAKSNNNVVIGRSWGSLSKGDKEKWDMNGCNELIKIGRLQSCDEKYGWGFLDSWRNNTKQIVTGISSVVCARNLKSSSFCRSSYVMLDYGKVGSSGGSRMFNPGFLNTYGTKLEVDMQLDVPGIRHHETGEKPSDNPMDRLREVSHCDLIIDEPTFVLSNDDIYNLGHYINDVMGIWAMVTLANRDSKTSHLLNFDGIRRGGPAGGPPHRLMEANDPDKHGPYVGYFDSWFAELHRAIDYSKQKVCYKEIYFPPSPGVPWFWNDWSIINSCSMKAGSPLYQSFNAFLLQRWSEKFGPKSLVFQKNGDLDSSKFHVVIEVRAINRKKSNNHSSARHIRNLNELIAALESIPNVQVTAQDFAKIPFAEQVALSNSADIFLSMHGAGTTHIFHMPVGKPHCCALVELQPDHSIGFQTAQGYGNLARMFGMYHYRYEAADGLTGSEGTKVEVKKVRSLVVQAVKDIQRRATCFNEYKDSRHPLFSQDLV